MGFFDSLNSFWHWNPTVSRKGPINSAPRGRDIVVPNSLGGMVLSHKRSVIVNPTSGITRSKTVIQPPDPYNYWRDQGLDAQAFSLETPAKLLELLTDLSPDISRAVWDFLLFCNPGYEIICYKPGTDTLDSRAQKILDEFLAQLKLYYGTLDVIFERLFMSAYLRGAFFAELILDNAGRQPIDLSIPDPAIVRFVWTDDPVRGRIPQIGYMQGQNFIPIDKPTVQYIPVHPFPGNPYGRPVASAALFSTVFLIGMMNDIRRVIAQQGYPRLHIKIDLEALAATMPSEMAQDPEVFQAWVDKIYINVRSVYAQLEPEDAYISTSMIEITNPIGAVDSTSIGAVDNIIEMLERHVMRALKSMPLLMGVVEGMSEANANRQWEIHVAGIKSLQHRCENLLERLFILALQAQGIQTDVKVRFAELRTAERLRDEMTRQLMITNTLAEYFAGWRDHESASVLAIGQLPAEKEPIAWPKNQIPAGPGNQIEQAGASEDDSISSDGADDKGPIGDDRTIEAIFWPLGKPRHTIGGDDQQSMPRR